MLAILWGCQPKTPSETEQNASPHPAITENSQPPATLIWPLITHMTETSLKAAEILNQRVTELLENPTEETLNLTREQWHETHKALQTLSPFAHMCASYRRLASIYNTFYNLAAWPFEPGYIDSFGPYRFSGLVNDISVALTPQSLREQHGLSDPSALSTGIYPLGYLLFGQNDQRSPEAFLAITELQQEHREIGFQEPSEIPNNRRRTLLQRQSELLIKDLQTLHTQLTSRLTDSAFDRYRSKSNQQQLIKLLAGVQSTLVGQMTTISEEQKSATGHIGLLTLIQRLQYQTKGMEAILTGVYSEEEINAEQEALKRLYNTLVKLGEKLSAVQQKPPAPEETQTELIWAPAYQNVNQVLELIMEKSQRLQLLTQPT